MKIFFRVQKGSCRCGGFDVHEQIERRQILAFAPPSKDLSDPSFHFLSCDCTANLSADRQPKPGSTAFVWGYVENC